MKDRDLVMRVWDRVPETGWVAETPEDLFCVLNQLAHEIGLREDGRLEQLLARVWRLNSPILKRINSMGPGRCFARPTVTVEMVDRADQVLARAAGPWKRQVKDAIEAALDVAQWQDADEDTVIARAKDILARRVKVGPVMDKPSTVFDYITLHAEDADVEVFSVMWLDDKMQFLRIQELARGTINGAHVYPREVVKSALAAGANAAIFMHNHPSGVLEASRADIQITNRLKDALALIDVRVVDHVIVGAGKHLSMAEKGWV